MDFKEILFKNLSICGNHYFVMSQKCYGCYDFNYLCGGSCFGNCERGDFENDVYSFFADIVITDDTEVISEIFKKNNIDVKINNYVFALLMDIEERTELVSLKAKLEEKYLNANNNERTKNAYRNMCDSIGYALNVSDEDIFKISEILHLNDSQSDGKVFMNSIIEEYKRRSKKRKEEHDAQLEKEIRENCKDEGDIPF